MGTWQRAGKTKSTKKRVKVKDLPAAKKKTTPREMEEVKCGLTVDPSNPNIVCNPTRGESRGSD